MKIMDDKSIRSALVPTPQPAAGWDRAALRKLVDAVWNAATESTAVPSTKWADRLIDGVRREAPAPAEGVTDGCGDVFKDLDIARPDTAEATLADLIREYANDLRRNSSGSDDYPWDWAKATADYLEVLIDRSSTQREVLCEGAYYLTRGNKNNLQQLIGPLAPDDDPEFPWKATVYGSVHRWKSDGTSAESPVRDIVGDPVFAWPNDTAEARLREALDLLQLQQRGRAKALRMLDARRERSEPETLARAEAYEECGLELEAALSPPSGGDEAKESDKTGMRVEDKPRSHGESLQYGPDTSSSSSTAATPHGKGSDAASVAIPVASSDLLVSQEAPVLSEPSPPADRREIVAWFKDRIDKYATQLNATGQADVAHLLRRDAQIILAALDGGRDA